MAAKYYIKQLRGRIITEIDCLEDVVFKKSNILDWSITKKDVFLSCFRKLKNHIKSQYGIEVPSLCTRQSWERYSTITFKNGKNVEHNEQLYMLPCPSYRVPELNFTEKYTSKAISTIVDNSLILSLLNTNIVIPAQDNWKLVLLYMFFFCNKYLANNMNVMTVEDLVILCINNYYDRKYSTMSLRQDVTATNLQNIESVYHHSDVITLGYASQSTKRRVTINIKNAERDKFVLARLADMSYRKIVKEYEEQFGKKLSTRDISDIKKKYATVSSCPGTSLLPQPETVQHNDNQCNDCCFKLSINNP